MISKQIVTLMLFRAYGDLRAEAARYYISYAWWILEPLLQLMVYWFVFGVLFEAKVERFVSFLLIGLVFWRWITANVADGSYSLLANRHIITQVWIPKFVFPCVVFLVQGFKFLVIFLLLLVYLWIAGHPPSLAYLALIPLFVILLVFTGGIALIFSSLYPFLPDLRLLVETTLRLMFFLSAVFYQIQSVDPKYHIFFLFNPFAQIIEGARVILIHQQMPDWMPLLFALTVGLALVCVGLKLLNLFDRDYAKVVR
jgi:lipopolysaccharide transport system permease protein